MFWPDPKPNRIVGVQYRTNGGCAGGLGGQEWNSYFRSGPAHIILDLPTSSWTCPHHPGPAHIAPGAAGGTGGG